ncbi:hypothetical protein AAC387_Pa04g1249 [Persea americana]
MSSGGFLKRSSPSIRQISQIQRPNLRLFSTSSPQASLSSLPSSSNLFREQSHDFNTWKSKKKDTDSVSGVFLKSLSGILVGSSLGLWLLSSSIESSFSFSDWRPTATAIAKDDRQENPVFPREISSPAPRRGAKYLFPDEFRRRVFFNYEKRIRLRSPPEKIFEYFASLRNHEGELFMTPADLMRAVVPVFPPSESNIVREGSLRGERPPGELHCADSEFFMFFDTNNDGLISFPEYIFFVTLLSLPESSFSVAFKMFDLDNSGEIERDEFKQVMNLMRSCNRQGASHRDGLRIGLKARSSVENGGLVEYFFGKDGNEALQHGKFVEFLKNLHNEILHLEFAHYDYKLRGTISAKDFALSMVAAADMNHINKFLVQVDELENDPHLRDMRITFKEFKDFAELRKKLQPLALALFSYGTVKGLLTKNDFQRAASHVCGISVGENVAAIIFHVFDLNHDGNLSLEEFLFVLQKREKDIGHPSETGIVGLISCWWNCAKSSTLVELLK